MWIIWVRIEDSDYWLPTVVVESSDLQTQVMALTQKGDQYMVTTACQVNWVMEVGPATSTPTFPKVKA